MIKHPLYILVDDRDDFQLPRYEKKLGSKATIINYNNFKRMKEKMEKNKEYEALLETTIYCSDINKYHFIKKYLDIYQLNLKNKGINNRQNIFDDISVIETLVETFSKEREVDFICIDSLLGLFGTSQRITREKIDRITKIADNYKITLLVIHHTQSSKEIMLNTSSIEGSFYNQYILSDRDENKNNEKSKILKLTEKAKYTEGKIIYIRRSFIDNLICTYELVNKEDMKDNISSNNKGICLDDEIERIILKEKDKKNNSITKVNLISLICRDPCPKNGSILNSLNNLKKKGLISKTDGKWDIIQIN